MDEFRCLPNGHRSQLSAVEQKQSNAHDGKVACHLNSHLNSLLNTPLNLLFNPLLNSPFNSLLNPLPNPFLNPHLLTNRVLTTVIFDNKRIQTTS